MATMAMGIFALILVLGVGGIFLLKKIQSDRAAAAERNFVKIQFESKPAGADVFRVPSGEKVGTVPFELKLKRSTTEEETFEFRLEGHKNARRRVVLNKNRVVTGLLEKEEAEKEAPSNGEGPDGENGEGGNDGAGADGAKEQAAPAPKGEQKAKPRPAPKPRPKKPRPRPKPKPKPAVDTAPKPPPAEKKPNKTDILDPFASE
jgi:hypothetical protein